MKSKYSFFILAIALTTVAACQMVKLPFLKDQQEKKAIETPVAENRPNTALNGQENRAGEMDPVQPGVAETIDTPQALDDPGNAVTAAAEGFEDVDSVQPGVAETAETRLASNGPGNAVTAAAERLEAVDPVQAGGVETAVLSQDVDLPGHEDKVPVGLAGNVQPEQLDGVEKTESHQKALPGLEEANRQISRSYVELGRAHINARQIDEARRSFKKAMDYDENCQDCPALLAQCRQIEGEVLRRKGEEFVRAKQFDDAAQVLERALALNSDDAVASDWLFQSYYQNALELYDKGKYLEARTVFEKAIVVNPSCTDCKAFIEDSLEKYKERHYNEGIRYFDQEDLKQAISSWEKVVEIDPEYKNVRENLKKANLMSQRIEMIRQHTGN